MNRAVHYLDYNDVHDELTIANAFAQAILTFRGGAAGKEAPIRIIQGPHTQLESPDFGISVDPVNNEIYVAEHDHILVFPRTANGDVAPIRVLAGPKTQLKNTQGYMGLRGIGADWVHNVLVVSGYYQGKGHILIFNRTANGDTAPLRVIAGPKSRISGSSYTMRVYPAKGWIFNPMGGGIGVWSVNDSGDIPPQYILSAERPAGEAVAAGSGGDGGGEGGGGGGGLGAGTRFSFNPKAKEFYIESNNSLKAYSFPEIF
jgi:hypothetical protein